MFFQSSKFQAHPYEQINCLKVKIRVSSIKQLFGLLFPKTAYISKKQFPGSLKPLDYHILSTLPLWVDSVTQKLLLNKFQKI
jgi:hypothetical protein